MPQFILDRLHALWQYPVPHHIISRLMYKLTRLRWPPIKNFLIHLAIKQFNIDMSLAQETRPEAYESFNHFFTRALRNEVRPIVSEDSSIACPVDGAISQIGSIHNGRVFQAKGHDYSLQTLLGGFQHLHDLFTEGTFSTIYLSPRDYHRIHMPLTGKLLETVYVPGRLFSVNPATTRTIPGLFARNERLATIFETEHGPMAVILVGAICVAGIETVWSGNYGDKTFRAFEHKNYRDNDALPDITLNKGEEMGRFNMGSTVVLLFAKDSMQWCEKLAADQSVKMGQLIGKLNA